MLFISTPPSYLFGWPTPANKKAQAKETAKAIPQLGFISFFISFPSHDILILLQLNYFVNTFL